ncbi:response regulator containing a CheY-like receiver domain and a GGDEF domain [Leptolyngbyaceae cyanobacterium JSC-12]|nr:response regulator containing a CheY-like receiver domain and a GGDEF domain [Leptolyngbyaceae cyanobacterium JSC-12]
MQSESFNQPGNILVVDDLTDNLRILSNALSNHGYQVRAVRNGVMALLGAKAAPPDVILLDICMPGMDGYEVCRELKSEPQTREIPIIFLSALDENLDKSRAFAAGGADYITKPFQIEELLARVQHQLTIQQLRKQVAAQQQQLEQFAASLMSQSTVRRDELERNALPAIANILNCTARLCENPEIDSELHTVLKVIHQNGQQLLSLLQQF